VSDTRLGKLLVHFSHYSLASLLTTIAGLISFPLITRIFSVSDYGIMGLIGATVTITVAVGKLGIQHAVLRYQSEIAAGKRPFTLEQLSSTTVFGMGAAGLGAALLLLLWAALAPSGVLSHPELRGLLALSAVVVAVQVVESPLVNILRAEQRTKVIVAYQVLKRYAALGLLLLALFAIAESLTVFYSATALAEVAAVIALTLALLAGRGRAGVSLRQFSPSLFKEMLKFGIPMMVGYELSGIILAVGDRYAIEWLVGTEPLGLYSAAYNLCQYVQSVFIASVAQAIVPLYMQMWDQQGPEETVAFVGRSLRTYVLFGAPVIAGVAAVGPELLPALASDRYAGAAGILAWVVAGMVLDGAAAMLGAGLFIHRRTRRIMAIVMSCAGLNMVLNFVLVPRVGIVGAAIATLVAYAASSVLLAAAGRSLFRVEIPWATMARAGAASAVMYLAVVWILPGQRLLTVLVRALVGAVLYAALLLLVDEDARKLARSVLGRFTVRRALWPLAVVASLAPWLPARAAGAASAAGAAQATGAGSPIVAYTDVLSGPTRGGDKDAGVYLSIFGKGFGAGGLGTSVRVYIGGAEVRRYVYLGASRGRADIQQITVQPGGLGNATPGKPLPIDVVVNGIHSNADHTFTVNPGRLLFVDNVRGNDATAVPGDPARPFRTVQTRNLSAGAYGKAGPGDVIVLRGTGTAWTDVGFEGYFLRFRDKSGSAPSGAAGTGPITVMGYPGEDAFIRGTLAGGMTGGCISAINGQTYPGRGQWVVIAGLRIDCEGYDGPISQEIHGHHWRVVNNDLSASTAPTTGPSTPRMGGITGNGLDSAWLGNHIHDIQGSQDECHGVYIDGDGSYEIAFNHIHDIRSGNGLQVFVNGRAGSATASNVSFHHNLVHDVDKHGLNVADGSQAGFRIFDNVVLRTRRAGIRFNTVDLRGAQIFGNTFYDTNTGSNPNYGALSNDARLPPDALHVEGNVFWPHVNTRYVSGSVGFGSPVGVITNNVWYGGLGVPLRDAAPVLANPGFLAAGRDFHLVAGGAAAGAGGAASDAVRAVLTSDFDLSRRRAGAPLDAGAYALRP
jgi:O-antigen/teichoic acid export membrane protein